MFARDSPFILKNRYRYHRVVRRLFRNANCASTPVSDSRGRLGFDPRPVLPLESTKKHELQINMEIEDDRGKKFDATRRCPYVERQTGWNPCDETSRPRSRRTFLSVV